MTSEPEKLDHLLGDFFRNELPAPWPPHRVNPAAQPARPRSADAGRSSRVALAASAAALLAVGAYLSYSAQAPKPISPAAGPGLLAGGTANGAGLLDNIPAEKPPAPPAGRNDP